MKEDDTRNTRTASSKSTDVVPSRRALLRAASAAPVVLTAPNLAFAATASALDCLNTPPSSATVVTSEANDDVFRVQVDVATYTLDDNTVVDAYTVPGTTPPLIITLNGTNISNSFTPSPSNPADSRPGFAIAYVYPDGMASGTIGHVTPGSTETLAFNSCLASIDMS